MTFQALLGDLTEAMAATAATELPPLVSQQGLPSTEREEDDRQVGLSAPIRTVEFLPDASGKEEQPDWNGGDDAEESPPERRRPSTAKTRKKKKRLAAQSSNGVVKKRKGRKKAAAKAVEKLQ